MALVFWHELAFQLLVLLIIVVGWRLISRIPSVRSRMHALPFPFNLAVQWYVTFIGSLWYAFSKAFIGTFFSKQCLDPSCIENRFKQIAEHQLLSEEELSDRSMTPWLRGISMSSFFAGGVAFVLVQAHLLQIIRRSYWWSCSHHDSDFPWSIMGRTAMAFKVVAMPSVYICMSLQSASCMWMVMSGSHVGQEAYVDEALYSQNFELAAICQYYVVFVFARLCMRMLERQNASEEMKTAMSTVGFQGVYAWCLAGIIHSIIVFSYTFADWPSVELEKESLDQMRDIADKVGLVSSAASILATINMLMICNLDCIQHRLNMANLKFNGTKILLLIGPNQLKVIFKVAQKIPVLDMSRERVMLLHSALMCYECLIVALINYYAWEVKGTTDRLKSTPGHSVTPQSYRRFLKQDLAEQGYQLLPENASTPSTAMNEQHVDSNTWLRCLDSQKNRDGSTPPNNPRMLQLVEKLTMIVDEMKAECGKGSQQEAVEYLQKGVAKIAKAEADGDVIPIAKQSNLEKESEDAVWSRYL